jgi:hypothetical protein
LAVDSGIRLTPIDQRTGNGQPYPTNAEAVSDARVMRIPVDHCEVIETDLDERIQQLDDEPPSHIVVPAVHKLRSNVSEVFARDDPAAEPGNDDAHYLAERMRCDTRRYFLRAQRNQLQLMKKEAMRIIGNLHQAYRDPRFKTARYAVLVSGLPRRPTSKES